MQAQVCSGNLGANIFEDGDFGIGSANILVPDPGIAPGYNYTTNPPPNDGFYTVSNNTGAWSGLFPTWLSIQDNSDNPNGYMMVVNASFSTGIFYEQEIDDLCENTLYEFSADIINLIAMGVTGHIRPNVTFLLNDEVRFTTGEIPQNNQWNTYGFTFTTEPGETTVKLSLRNNAPGGIGNDLALDNITFRACGPEALILPTTIANICEDGSPITLEATINGDQYPNAAVQWQRSSDGGLTWEDIPGATSLNYVHTELSSGVYYYRYLLANGTANIQNTKCRIISNVKIVNVVPKFYNVIDTICEGSSLIVGNSEYTIAGVYTDSLISSIGCDSIVTIDLSVVSNMGISASINATMPTCAGFSDATIAVSDIENAYLPYQIQFEDITLDAPDAFFDLLPSGSYSMSIVDYFGCTLEETITIDDPLAFSIDAGPDWSVDLGESIQINTSSNYNISSLSWDPEIDFLCSNACLNVQGTPTISSSYVITAVSEFGCVAVDSIFIEVNPVRDIYIPNVFSPNDDGFNDRFTVFGKLPSVVAIDLLQIFDRWGNLVYEAKELQPNDVERGWNGRFGGKTMGNDVYLYVAKIRFLDGIIETYSGDVLLLR